MGPPLIFQGPETEFTSEYVVGTSANALQTQIWTEFIAILPIKYLQLKATFGWSLSNLAALLRQQLFVYRDFPSCYTI